MLIAQFKGMVLGLLQTIEMLLADMKDTSLQVGIRNVHLEDIIIGSLDLNTRIALCAQLSPFQLLTQPRAHHLLLRRIDKAPIRRGYAMPTAYLTVLLSLSDFTNLHVGN